ncbi:MAG: hypothetical protein AAGK67_18260 [Pseudomonadota bacterium]
MIFSINSLGVLKCTRLLWLLWQGNLGIWGEEMIESTAINEELGIDTPQKNVAARVNIHLHRQAFYGAEDIGGMNLDEDWED